MSNQGSNSQICYSGTGGGQLRYKKALKQISKLVSMNTGLKKQIDQWQKNYHKMEQDYFKLLDKFNNASSNNVPFALANNKQLSYSNNNDVITNQGQGQTNSPPTKRINTQSVLMDQQVYVNMDSINTNTQNNNRKQLSGGFNTNQSYIQQIKYLQNRLKDLQLKISQKDDIIHQLQLALQKKHLQNLQLQGRYGDLNQKYIKSSINVKQKQKQKQRQKQKQKERQVKQVQSNIVVSVSEELMKQRRKVQELQGKLLRSQDWAKKLAYDYQQLRKRILFSQESIQSGSTASLKMPNIVRLNSTQTQIPKKSSTTASGIGFQVQKLVQELNRKTKEFNQKKNKYKTQISMLKQQIQNLNGRISSINAFIEKQQFYIQNYVQKEQGTN